MRLRELGGALAELPTDEWQARSVLEHILRPRLALTRDPEFAGAVRDLARVHDAPYLASLVASGQRPEVAASVAQGEFGACLAQELVLRSNGAALDESCWRRGHPLAWLPLRLAEIEEGVELPHYSEGGVGFAMLSRGGGGHQSPRSHELCHWWRTRTASSGSRATPPWF